MSSSYISDNRTLYIKCDCASVQQIRDAFSEALTTYQDATGIDLACRFRVNLVEDREGRSFGIAFVFVSNPAVYYMLLGKNPDGSDRVEYRDDPSWTPPVEGESVNDAGWSTISAPVFSKGMTWADIMDEEDAYNAKIEAEKQKYVCPKIAFSLEPLMVLPPYRLSAQQIAEKRDKIIEENEGKSDFDADMVEIPPIAYFGVEPAVAKPVDQKFMPNILKCKNVPDWVTKEDLKAQFSPYASDSLTLQERHIKGRRVEETYPFVNINDDRVAFIIFDPSTNDALFALHMMKKIVITKTLPNKTVNKVVLLFGHSFRTDRDMMADISQRPRPVQRRENANPPRGNNYGQTTRSSYENQGQRGNSRGGQYGRQDDRRDERRDDGSREIHRPPNQATIRAVATAQPKGAAKKTAEFKNQFSALDDD